MPIVRKKSTAQNPGVTKDFRLPFDTIPESWKPNHAPPGDLFC